DGALSQGGAPDPLGRMRVAARLCPDSATRPVALAVPARGVRWVPDGTALAESPAVAPVAAERPEVAGAEWAGPVGAVVAPAAGESREAAVVVRAEPGVAGELGVAAPLGAGPVELALPVADAVVLLAGVAEVQG